MHVLRFLRGLGLALLIASLSTGWAGQPASPAPEAGPLSSLPPDERAAAGWDRLTLEQQTALNDLVRREVRLARQGDVIAFAGTFSSRRPASEFAGAGLGTLTPEELRALDQAVARLLAQRPVEYLPRTEPGTAVETVTRRAQWRGEITAIYGRGSGGREF